MPKPKRDITVKDIARYVQQGGPSCPFCSSNNLTPMQFDPGEGQVWQNVVCENCGAEWQDVYELTQIDIFRTPDERQFDPGTYPIRKKN